MCDSRARCGLSAKCSWEKKLDIASCFRPSLDEWSWSDFVHSENVYRAIRFNGNWQRYYTLSCPLRVDSTYSTICETRQRNRMISPGQFFITHTYAHAHMSAYLPTSIIINTLLLLLFYFFSNSTDYCNVTVIRVCFINFVFVSTAVYRFCAKQMNAVCARLYRICLYLIL